MKIKKVEFTSKHPFLYQIELKDGVYKKTLSTVCERRAVNVLSYLKENDFTDWDTMPLKAKNKMFFAGMC